MKTTITMLSIMILFMVSCTSSEKKESEKPLMDQVMELHDEVMPKMGDLMKTKKALLAKAAEVESDSVAADLKSLAEDIDLANEAMMDWMRNFDPNFEGSEEEIEAYLLKKKKGIEKVAEMMNTSLAAGQMAAN